MSIATRCKRITLHDVRWYFSDSTYNAIWKNRLTKMSIGDFFSLQDETILNLKHFGPKSLANIRWVERLIEREIAHIHKQIVEKEAMRGL